MNKNILLMIFVVFLVFSSSVSAVSEDDILPFITDFWMFEDGLTATTGGVDFTATGSIDYVNGRVGRAVNIDLGEYLTGDGAPVEGSGDYTVFCWINLHSSSDYPTIIDNIPSTGGFEIRKNSGAGIRFRSGTGSGGDEVVSSSIPSTGSWELWGGMRNNSYIHSIYNNNFEGSTSSPVHAENGGVIMMGIRSDLSATTRFDGYIDDCIVMNKAINQSELDYIYNSGNGRSFYTDDLSLSVSAIDDFTSSSISSFNSSIYYPDGSLLLSNSTTSGLVVFNMTDQEDGNYTLSFVSDFYQDKNVTIEYLNASLFYEFNTILTPAVNISVRSEVDGSLITELVNMLFVSNSSSFSNSTISGHLYTEDVIADDYSIVFSSDNYTSRQYRAFLTSNTYQELVAYLIPSGSPDTVFTFKDKNNGAELEGVSLSVETFINGTYSTVEVLSSDITGKAQFDFVEEINYRFTAIKSGYDSKVFSLSPILFDAYTINLDRDTTYIDTGDFSGVSIYISPDEYYNTANNTVSLTFVSPDGLFSSFGFNVSFGSESVVRSSSSVYGTTLSGDLEILNASLNDVVTLDYFYVTSLGVSKSFSLRYFVVDASNTNTWATDVGDDYDLGILERLLIVTSVVLVVAGMITMFSNVQAGGVSALFVWGFFVWTKFISFWYVATSVIVIVVVLMWRSTR